MGLITRQELSPVLRQELDDVRNYIDATDALRLGEHIANEDNPHNVTKAQVGLGNVINEEQATKVEFNNHLNDTNNPHNVTADQIGAVPVSRSVTAGDGLVGGGVLNQSRELSVDYARLNTRYVTTGGTAYNSDRLGGLSASSYHRTGSRFLDMGAGRQLFYGTDGNNLYFRQSGHNDKRIYHNGNIRWGTANPTGGADGDIYIQY